MMNILWLDRFYGSLSLQGQRHVQQVNETMDMFTALPEVGGGGKVDPDTISYRKTKRKLSYVK